MKLSVPYTRGVSDLVEKYIDYIDDVYFSDSVLLSARPKSDTIGYEIKLYTELKKIQAMGVKTNFVLNSPLINKPTEKFFNKPFFTLDHLNRIRDKFDIITVNNLFLMLDGSLVELLKEKEFKNSVNNHIDSMYRLKELFKIYPFDYVNIDRSLNRDKSKLNALCREVQSHGAKAVVLVNEGCHFRCAVKQECDISVADPNQALTFDCYDYYLKGQPENLLKSPIIYHETAKDIDCDILKLSGRDTPKDIVEMRIRHYLFGDDILIRDLIDKPIKEVDLIYDLRYSELLQNGFIKKVNDCKNHCEVCDFCDKIKEIL